MSNMQELKAKFIKYYDERAEQQTEANVERVFKSNIDVVRAEMHCATHALLKIISELPKPNEEKIQ